MSDESNNGLPPQDENPIVPAEETIAAERLVNFSRS